MLQRGCRICKCLVRSRISRNQRYSSFRRMECSNCRRRLSVNRGREKRAQKKVVRIACANMLRRRVDMYLTSRTGWILTSQNPMNSHRCSLFNRQIRRNGEVEWERRVGGWSQVAHENQEGARMDWCCEQDDEGDQCGQKCESGEERGVGKSSNSSSLSCDVLRPSRAAGIARPGNFNNGLVPVVWVCPHLVEV